MRASSVPLGVDSASARPGARNNANAAAIEYRKGIGCLLWR
jgi:hypothetical protein